jgi:2-keto-4-pentenoate hydratase/2-oxohepta-3-ene-1,7-dioic acid hydratase in catechol pathway
MSERPRFLSFSQASTQGFGLLIGDRVIDLTARADGRWPTFESLLQRGAMRAAADAFAAKDGDFTLADIVLQPPLPRPGKILCVGVNYPDRADEYAGEITAPAYPSLFPRFPQSFVGHDQPLIRPTVSDQLDYEGEIVVVIGTGGRHIPEASALDHIAALTLCNEGSVRDWLRHGKFNVTQGKNFDRSGSLGPWLTAYESEEQIADIRLTTRVNGEIRQDDRTSRMLFSFRRLLSYISTFTTLMPGDVIVTGTPTGAGARSDPPIWLKPGDVVEVEADGLGVLRNTITDERISR